MKALSVKQPWANIIASGQKTIETRLWATDHRGELLIVSSKKPKIEPAGFAVAVAKLVDCRPMTLADEMAAMCNIYQNAFAWVLEDIRALQPFPVSGQLGVFDIDVPKDKLIPGTRPIMSLFDYDNGSTTQKKR
jgi:hypothetical protein